MKYIIYSTINKKSKINGNFRIYIGVHATENPNHFDGYIGSGVKVLQHSTFKYPKTPFQYAVKKYGTDAFERTTLFIFDSKEEAYNKLSLLLTPDFLKADYTYNTFSDIGCNPLYQFTLEGKLVKKWDSIQDASDFYGYPIDKFKSRHAFLNSYWNSFKKIDLSKYSEKPLHYIYLYSKNGKLLHEFESIFICSKYLNKSEKEIKEAIKTQLLIDNYYISNKIVDQFIPKCRNNYKWRIFYVYDSNNNFLGKHKGKALMKVINLHSWKKINNIFTINHNWYKDFYISFDKVDKVPIRELKKLIVEIYDKYGNFIEKLPIKEVKEKYNVPSAKLKNILQGGRYFGDYIFKYNK